MSKPKVLILVDWFWPGYRAGGPITSTTNLVRWLKNKVDFRVITSDTDYLHDQPYPGIKSNDWNEVLGGVKVYYADMKSLSYKKLKALALEEKVDYVYLNSLWSIPFTMYPLRIFGKKQATEIVLAPRGMLSPQALKMKALKKRTYLKAFKLLGMHRKVTFQATSDREEAEVKKEMGKVRFLKAPNLPEPLHGEWQAPAKKAGELRLVSVSRIAPEKNNLHLIQALSLSKAPLQLDLYGPSINPEYLKSCKEAIAAAPEHVRITWHDKLPKEEVPAVLEKAHAFVLTTFGENFGHAIYEAMAMGRPVLISNTTPWRNLEAQKAGWDLPLEPREDFAQAAEKLSAMPSAEFNEWSKGAWQLARNFIFEGDAIARNLRLFGLED